jgi:hypothetical protein
MTYAPFGRVGPRGPERALRSAVGIGTRSCRGASPAEGTAAKRWSAADPPARRKGVSIPFETTTYELQNLPG